MSELVNVFSPDIRKKIKKEVPTIEGAWVEFYDDLLAGEIQDFSGDINKMSEKEKGNQGYEFVKTMISDWNFADLDEKKMEITVKNIRRLPLRVQGFLAETAGSIFESALPKKELPVS
jgi:hypothetical protein